MIYIYEGVHGSGKSTRARSHRLPILRRAFNNYYKVVNELETQQENVVYDRLFIYGFLWADMSDEEFIKLNNYLKSRSDIKCIKCITTLDQSFEIYYSRNKDNLQSPIYLMSFDEAKNYYEKHIYNEFVRILNLMDVFKDPEE